jgi:hypothetical protein
MHRAWIFVLFAGATACVSAEDVAKTRAANDFGCQEVEVASIGGNSFRAEGCGKRGVYNCVGSDAYRGSTTDYTCTPEGVAPPVTPAR